MSTESITSPISDIQAAIDAGTELAIPHVVEPDNLYAVIVPAGAEAKLLNLEQHLAAPRRKHGTATVHDVASFIEVVDEHKDVDHTTVWVGKDGAIVAVINDHAGTDDDPGWGDHRVDLRLEHTDEWRFWLAADSRLMDQEAFANHVEQGTTEILEPAAADMLEIAQSFHATTSAAFRSARRLQDGSVQMQYDENVEATAGQTGQLEIPKEFVLAVSPFIGEEPYRVVARLRYRLSGGKLSIGYQLDRPANVVRDCLDKIADRLGAQFGHVYRGVPRS